MPLFEDGTNENSDDNQTSYVDRLVELKGDQWKDVETLAKGYLSSQEYISQLEEKAKAAEAAKSQEDFMSEIKELLQGKTTSQATPPVTETQGSVTSQEPDTKATVSEEDVEGLVERLLTKKEQENTAAQNLDDVRKKLKESYGDQAKNVFAEKSKALGMSEERLEALAKESPTAFMALMGNPPTKETNQSVQSSKATTAFMGSQERDQRYYFELMRKHPKQYGTREVQEQMVADRKRLGPKFFTN